MTWLEHLFALTCHQLPERSPHFAGVVFPVCFRMAGLYLGVVASYWYLVLSGGWPRRLPTGVGVAISVAVVPFLIDGWANTLHLWSSPAAVRALTGLGAGIALPRLLAPLSTRCSAIVEGQPTHTLRSLSGALRPAVLGLALVGLLLHPGSALLFAALAFVAAAGFLLLAGNLLWAARPGMWSGAVARGSAR